MVKEFKCEKESAYYLAYTLENKIFHFGELKMGQNVSTGQEVLETFNTEIELSERLGVLTENPTYYDEYKKSFEEKTISRMKNLE